MFLIRQHSQYSFAAAGKFTGLKWNQLSIGNINIDSDNFHTAKLPRIPLGGERISANAHRHAAINHWMIQVVPRCFQWNGIFSLAATK